MTKLVDPDQYDKRSKEGDHYKVKVGLIYHRNKIIPRLRIEFKVNYLCSMC